MGTRGESGVVGGRVHSGGIWDDDGVAVGKRVDTSEFGQKR